jgi:hypothetical protein
LDSSFLLRPQPRRATPLRDPAASSVSHFLSAVSRFSERPVSHDVPAVSSFSSDKVCPQARCPSDGFLSKISPPQFGLPLQFCCLCAIGSILHGLVLSRVLQGCRFFSGSSQFSSGSLTSSPGSHAGLCSVTSSLQRLVSR